MLTGIPPFTGNSAEEVFSSVMNSKDTLKFPPDGNYSDSAKDFIRKFLCSPKERLGYNGVGEIKKHEFFNGIDWKNLDSIIPDFVPELEDELDIGYFDSATAEGIENMKMDDRGDTELLDPEEDPWAKHEWNWSAIP
jgi:serine/threonine protein kinase